MRSSYSSLGPILLAVGLGLMGTVDGGAAEPTGAVLTNTSVSTPAASPTIVAPVVTPEASTATPVSQPSAGPRVVARVDLSGQLMTVTIDGKPTYTWRISSGAQGFRTPNGAFAPQILSKHHRSSLYYGAPMPYAVFFNGHIATHGTNAVRQLGRPASHGCVRLDTANAKIFFELVQKYGKSDVRIIVDGTTPTNGISVAQGRRSRPTTSGMTSAVSATSTASWARQAFSAN